LTNIEATGDYWDCEKMLESGPSCGRKLQAANRKMKGHSDRYRSIDVTAEPVGSARKKNSNEQTGDLRYDSIGGGMVAGLRGQRNW